MAHIRRGAVEVLVNPGSAAAAYSTGDVVGALQTLSDVVEDTKAPALLKNVIVLDKANQKSAIDILIFNRSVTIAADNDAVTLSNTDLEYLVARISVAAADYTTIQVAATANAEATKSVEVLCPTVATLKNLYVAVVSRGSPTYTANALKVKMIFERF